jgi:hypothetical protein
MGRKGIGGFRCFRWFRSGVFAPWRDRSRAECSPVLMRLQLDLDSPEPGEIETVIISNALRVAKTTDEIEKPEEVFFEDVSMVVDPQECPKEIEEYWGEVSPSFVICWDKAKTGHRAYQLIGPNFPWKGDRPDLASTCGTFFHTGYKRLELVRSLDVYWPILDQYVQNHYILQDKIVGGEDRLLIDFIDEVLPRPHPPEG